MLSILVLSAAAVAAYLLWRRLQRSGHLASGVSEAPAPVRAAARRLSFRAQPDMPPIQSIQSPEICVAAMAVAFARMDGTAPPDDAVLGAALHRRLRVAADKIDDTLVLAHWLVDQGDGPAPAFERLTQRLRQLDHGPWFGKLMEVLGDVTAAGTRGMPAPRQADALGTLARIFRTA
jgi:hypothetical protein